MKITWNVAIGFALYGACALFLPSGASAQCTGQFGAFQTCATGATAGLPGPRNYTATLSSKTSNYTVLAADCMTEFTLGGSTQFTLTLGAASGYSAGCRITAYNSDTAAAKTLAVSGYANKFLWPTQTISYVSTGSAWIIESDPGRWTVTAATRLYVAPGACGGVDTNDGLASTRPVALIQTAYGRIQTQWDLLAPPTIKLTCGVTPFTVAESVSMFGTLSGTMLVGIEGDPTTPSNVVWDPGADNTNALLVRDFVAVDVNGIKFNTANSGVIFLNPSQGGIIDFRNVEFGAAPSGFHMLVNPGGFMTWTGGTYVVSGSMSYHRFVQGGRVDIPNVGSLSVPNALTFTQWDAIFQGGAVSYNGAIACVGAGCGAGSTGTKYLVSTGGSITLNTTVLPGNAAGTSNTFGSVLNPNFPSAYSGTGDLVFATSPTLVTPTLGAATATSINKVAITAPATAATLTIANNKTLTVSNTLTFTGTDGSSAAFGAGGTVAYTGGTLAQFAATTSAQLAGVISDETGSGALVFASTPTLVTPVLGAATGTSILLGGGAFGSAGEIFQVNGNAASHVSMRVNNTHVSGFSSLWFGTFNEGFIRYGSSVGDKLQIVASAAGVPVTLATAGTDRVTVNDGQIRVTPTTAATTTTDGALRSDGGLSVAGSAVVGGTVRANTAFSANGTAGQSVTTTVRASGGAADCTLIFTFGLKTGGTC